MGRIKIRNSRQRKWKRLLWIGIIGFIIASGMIILLSDNPVTPDKISGEGQFCRVTADWMSEAFAVETWDDEDMYDYHLIRTGDRFMIVSAWLDDGEFREYIDSLYDESGNYIPVEKELEGGSGIIDYDLRGLALEELSYDLGMVLTESDFDEYIYPYYLNTTNMGDFDTVMYLWLAFILVLLAAITGNLVLSIRHRRRMADLKNKIFYDRLVDCWSRSGEKMDTGKRPMVVLSDYLIVPDYNELVLPMEKVAWCYAIPQSMGRESLYAMCFDGRTVRLCDTRKKRGMSAEDYMQQIRLSAPWCRIGYTQENRHDFGDMKKKQILDQIAAEKNKYLSQIPL